MLRQIIGQPTSTPASAVSTSVPPMPATQRGDDKLASRPGSSQQEKENVTLRAKLEQIEAENKKLRSDLAQYEQRQREIHEELQTLNDVHHRTTHELNAACTLYQERYQDSQAQLKSAEAQLAKVAVVECNRKFATAVISCQVPHTEQLWAVLVIGDASGPVMNSVSVSEWGIRGSIEGHVFAAPWYHLAEAVLMLRPHGIELGGKTMVSLAQDNSTELATSVFSLLQGLQSSATLAIRAASQKTLA